MSIIPNLVTLGLAAALSSTVPQHQIDFRMPGPDSQHLNQIWLVTWIDEAGLEVVVQAKQTDGSYTPLIAATAGKRDGRGPRYGNDSQNKTAPDQIHQSCGSRRHRAMTPTAKRCIRASASCSGMSKLDRQSHKQGNPTGS
jgi:hypothetical protein